MGPLNKAQSVRRAFLPAVLLRWMNAIWYVHRSGHVIRASPKAFEVIPCTVNFVAQLRCTLLATAGGGSAVGAAVTASPRAVRMRAAVAPLDLIPRGELCKAHPSIVVSELTAGNAVSVLSPPPARATVCGTSVEVLNLTALPDAEIPEVPAPLSAALWALEYARTQTEKTLAALDRLASTVGKALVKHEGFDVLKLYAVLCSPYEAGEFIDMVNRELPTAFLKEEAVALERSS